MKGFAIIIPARYGSTRFEGKPIFPILGRPMIQHVYERAKMAGIADRVIVATDDESIFKTVKGFGGDAVMTSAYHKCGTDRLVEVAKSLDSHWIINLQGDEPLIDPKAIELLAREMSGSPGEGMFSLMRHAKDHVEYLNPNMVKVVTDHKGYALYFSRAPIPYPKGGISCERFPSSEVLPSSPISSDTVCIHCGIYGYRRDFLLRIPFMEVSFLEDIEGLEQLRILANGHKIRMILTDYISIGVDTREDIRIIEDLMSNRQI
ncbi:3-deoxy-manno-octulosonate cytidylyltransferase [bacterium]|nr:3-deoxy-manno-octulosonate cytidylyltransferase [bacterium]